VKVSIVILVHNALRYAHITLKTLAITRGIDHEVIVVDNGSSLPTRLYLQWAASRGLIHQLLSPPSNLLYAGGNNLGVSRAASDSTHVLLLNSDVRICSPDWLTVLLRHHKPGATAFGVASSPPTRADGYCLLIDQPLYARYKLDEQFKWFWSITKIQSQLLSDGFTVTAIRNHEPYLHHYGGKSRVKRKIVKESNLQDVSWIKNCLSRHQVSILESP
jgi:glycosyltransferase involved in cell wall biosynthesis